MTEEENNGGKYYEIYKKEQISVIWKSEDEAKVSSSFFISIKEQISKNSLYIHRKIRENSTLLNIKFLNFC